MRSSRSTLIAAVGLAIACVPLGTIVAWKAIDDRRPSSALLASMGVWEWKPKHPASTPGGIEADAEHIMVSLTAAARRS
jgi:hypothetical protein